MRMTHRLLTILALLAAIFAAVAPVHAAPDYDEAAMGTVYRQFSERADAYFEGTTSVCIVKQDVTTSAATNQQASYPFPAAAGTFEISSSDANDTGAVQIVYLDSSWDRQTVTMTLNGQTKVTSSVSAWRVLSARCANSGAQDTTNQGTIYVFTGDCTSGVPDDLATILAIIPIAHGSSKGAVMTTPRSVGKGMIRAIHYALAEGVDFEVYATVIDRTATYPVKRVYGPFHLFQATGTIPLDLPLGSKTDVYLTAKTGTAAQKAWLALETFYSVR